LSEDERVGVYLEDHYYSREDAAVVFKRVDHWTGNEKYIYHGNDGTSMPWNDTAQLNFLKAEVREAVIQTILHVARNFPVIRFDAAMTLAKKHYQRLWYPQPGTGGDIPSRSEFSLTREEFDNAMPIEFWREVVDRVAQEVPDTLLLAEAFWMMEGYFVRTLGMHRVYNSAFMNMLRDEKNDQYRQLIKNTLEFDPEILKRYVNFMNNPDEKTAIEQFGKDDKYFGVCTLMATMPGLPMFGHGQIEGYYEKYGMEYYRGYWEELPDPYLVKRHEKEIFPLLHRRYLFAEVENFYLYDFYNQDGYVEENVFAYSNRVGEPGTNYCQRSLVIFHNRWADVHGWIKSSAAFKDKNNKDDTLTQTTLGNGLGLNNDESYYTIFRDNVTGLQYIRNNRKIFEQGLYIELGAYKYQVYLDFQEIADNEFGQYKKLTEHLNGRGVPDIEEALKELYLQPIHHPFKEIINPGFFRWLVENRAREEKTLSENYEALIAETQAKLKYLYRGINELTSQSIDPEPHISEILEKLDIALKLPTLLVDAPATKTKKLIQASRLIKFGINEVNSLVDGDAKPWGILLGWLLTHSLGKVIPNKNHPEKSRRLMDDWLLEKFLVNTFQELGVNPESAWESTQCIKVLVSHQDWHKEHIASSKHALQILKTWLINPEVQGYLKIHEYQDVVWFNKEALESLLRWMLTIASISILADNAETSLSKIDDQSSKEIIKVYKPIERIYRASLRSEYNVEKLIGKLS
jgi:hypothetical protein